VFGAGINDPGEPQLPDPAEALERNGIDQV